MQKLLFVLIVLLTLGSCKKDKETFEVNPCGVNFETTLKYLSIGDEFNTGFDIEAEGSWPYEVRDYLIDNGYPDVVLTVIGEEDLSCMDLVTFITNNNSTNCKNLSTVMVGVHDILEGRSAADFKSDYETLTQQVIDYTGSTLRVTCVALPDFSTAPGLPESAGSPAEVKTMIEAYNVAIAEVCLDKGIGFADIYPFSEVSYSENGMLTDDEFHPSADQHDLWANNVWGVVEEGLD